MVLRREGGLGLHGLSGPGCFVEQRLRRLLKGVFHLIPEQCGRPLLQAREALRRGPVILLFGDGLALGVLAGDELRLPAVQPLHLLGGQQLPLGHALLQAEGIPGKILVCRAFAGDALAEVVIAVVGGIVVKVQLVADHLRPVVRALDLHAVMVEVLQTRAVPHHLIVVGVGKDAGALRGSRQDLQQAVVVQICDCIKPGGIVGVLERPEGAVGLDQLALRFVGGQRGLCRRLRRGSGRRLSLASAACDQAGQQQYRQKQGQAPPEESRCFHVCFSL